MSGLLAEAVRHHRAGRVAEAERAYRRILEAEPRNPDALHLLGLVHRERGSLGEAIALVRAAIEANPDDANYHNSLGVALLEAGDHAGAHAAFDAVLARDPGSAEARFHHGTVDQASGHLEAAAARYREALARDPGHLRARNNLGTVLMNLGRIDEAATAFEAVLASDPRHLLALRNLARLRRDQGRVDEARASFRAAAAIAPGDVEVQFGLALTDLLAGDLEAGFRGFECRHRLPDNPPRYARLPAWRGEALDGVPLLLWAEQGLGDTIQFVRFVRHAAARGARVVLACHEPLVSLLATVEGVSETMRFDRPAPGRWPQAALLGLPHLLGLGREALPGPIPYLRPPAPAFSLEGPRPHVGVVLTSRSRSPQSTARSLDADAVQALLAGLPGTVFNLQIDLEDANRERLRAAGAVDLAPEVIELGQTAAAMAALDAVVSVDTSAAHLAGALGRPLHLLLAHYHDWRWGVGRGDSEWYPSARLHRQSAPGDWGRPVAEVLAELAVRALT